MQESEKYPICPICEEEANTIYKDRFGRILGCDECVRECSAWDVMAELESFGGPDWEGEDGY